MFDKNIKSDTAEQMLFSMIESQTKSQPNLVEMEARIADIEAAFNYIWKEFLRGPGSYTREVEENLDLIQTNVAGLTLLAEELLDILETKGIITSKQEVIEVVTQKLREATAEQVAEENTTKEKRNTKKKKDKTSPRKAKKKKQ